MIKEMIIVTNNDLCSKRFKNKEQVSDIVFVDGSLMDVLIKVRDTIHNGHILLTHPLMSSVKPNETFYKTVCISKEKNKGVDVDSLVIIEDSIITARKLLKNSFKPVWNKKVLEDFKYIDYDIINSIFN